jgi:single-strand DNA-binding protein
MNKALLVGRFARDPYEMRGGGVSFTLACDDRGETEFLDCVAFGKTGELIAKYKRKGDLVTCTGKNIRNSFEKDGNKIYQQKILVLEVEFLGGGKRDGGDPFAGEGKQLDINDEDLPF